MNLNRIRILLMCAFITGILLPAMGRNFYFQHYDIKNGLSQNTVHSILQDSQGFLWFATKDGLNRFDGINFRRVSVDDTDDNGSFIGTLFEDSEGKIWVGTHHGIYVYDPQTERMDWLCARTEDNSRISSDVTVITESPTGEIILSVDNIGVYGYNRETGTLRSLLLLDNDIHTSINAIYFDGYGQVYLGTFGQGLFIGDQNFKSLRAVCGINGKPYFRNAVINSIKRKGDRIYIGTDIMGLHAIDIRTNNIEPVFVRDDDGIIPIIREIMFANQSEIWIGTENGVYIYDIASDKLLSHLTHNYFDKYSLSDDAIYSLMQDREGGIWIGSYFGGADYLSSTKLSFTKYNRDNTPYCLPSERVRELCSYDQDIIFVGSEDNGLSCFNTSDGKFTRVSGIDSKNIHGLCMDGSNLWVGTFADGLFIKDMNTGKVRNICIKNNRRDANNLKSNYIFTILRTLHGDMYIGTLSGMQHYDRTSDTFRDIDELGNTFVYDLKEDSHGDLWAATYSSGLFRRKAGEDKWTNYKVEPENRESLPSNKVYSISEDARHNLWIMTQNGACVFQPDSDSFDRHFMGIDRIKGVIYQVVDDDAGRYWLTSNHGIYCLDSESGSIRNFTTADGLPTNQFNYNSSLKTQDGNIYFGSIDGLVSFDPHRYTSTPPTVTKPVVSEIYLHGNLLKPIGENSPLKCSVSLTDRLDLEPHQNSLAIRIATLNYNSPADQRIKYMLRGFDNGWKYAGLNESLLNYSNLAYGTYKLLVAVCDDTGNTVGPTLELAINIARPFWLSHMAMCAYFIIICVIIYFTMHWYRRYSRLNSQRYIEHYTSEKEREAFESKIKFFTNVAHEIRTPLTLIKAPLDCVQRSSCLSHDPDVKENLDVIGLNVERLLQLANQLLDFRRMESGKFQITRQETDISELVDSVVTRFMPTIDSAGKRLDLSLPENHVMAFVDAEAITKILSNLFTNAIKYGNHYICLRLTAEATSFTLRMSNDGNVVDPEKREEIFTLFSRLNATQTGTGIGLSYARSLAQMHGGTLVMGPSEAENVFLLTLPYGSPDATADNETSHTDLEKMISYAEETISVLLVEDNAEMLRFIEKKLIGANFHVLKATNGLEALAILKEHYIDIVVSDVMMPEMDGMELLSIIKSDINYSHIPVILLTAKTRMDDKLQGLDAGADAYIEKPFAVEYLMATINSQLRNRDRMRNRLESMPLTKMPSKGLSKVDEEFLRKINEIIQTNFDNPSFSMEDVISALGMSRTTFYRKIKGLLDLSPNDYIKLQRLKRAAQLFREGHSSVSEVCYMVGFSSPGYFTKCFQKQFGLSPREYIASRNNNNEQ